MRRALLVCAAFAFAVACSDNITEPVPDRTARVAPPVAFATTTTEDGLSISTDKDDYQPGDVVHLTGSGWQPGDILDIVLTDDPLTHDPHTWTVSIEADGTFQDDTYVVDEGDVNVSFTLVATSRATSRSLTVNFTDSQPQDVALNPTSRSLAQGIAASALYDVTVTMVGNDNNCTVTLSVPAGLAAGVTPTFPGGLSTFTITTNATFTTTLTLSITAGTPASTSNFTVRATRGSDCQGIGVENGAGTLFVFGPAARLAFGQQPTNTQAASSITPAVTVRVLDAGNRLVANSTAPVALAIGTNPGGGTLSGTLTQNAAAGVATFTGLSIDKIGIGYRLGASSGVLTGATSNTFNITLGPAAKLAFTTQPGGAEPGSLLSPQPSVAVQDAGGNTVTGSTASITLSLILNGNTGVLTCAPLTRNAVAGIANFTGCSVSLAGTGYQLQAAASGLTTAISDPFNIVAANQAPVANDDSYSTNEDTPLSVSATDGVLKNDTDANGDALTAILVTGPASGSLTLNSDGSFNFTPAANFNGDVSFTYRANDGQVNSAAPATVTITVNAVNDPPSFTKGNDQTVLEDAGPQTVTGWASNLSKGPSNENGQTLTFQVTNNTNPSLFAAGPAISATGTLTYTPAADANGEATITIVLTDDGGTANGGDDTSDPQSFKITVTAVNDAPSFTKGADQTANEGAGLQTVTGWASNISAGPPDENGQALTFEVTGNTNPSIFSVAPAIASNGTLTYTPSLGPNGTSTITVGLKDDGGTANGGVDVSATQTFDITVNNVAPTIGTLKDENNVDLPTTVTVIIGGTLSFKVPFSDPGTADDHTAEVNCGSGYTDINGGATVASGFPASCQFSSIGPKTISVRVTDDHDTAEKLQNVLVVYGFSGFFAPVDRPNIMNVSKAGQAIPLKWRLTDAAGNGIAGVTGVTVQAYNMGCSAGAGSDLIEQYAAGSSGLQDLGDGYYQFNWKTPTSYVGLCKSIALTFGTGGLGYTEKPSAYFTFKK